MTGPATLTATHRHVVGAPGVGGKRRRGSSARCRKHASRIFEPGTPTPRPPTARSLPSLLADSAAATDHPCHGARFLTRDPLVATTQDPYGYAANNPVNMVDPLGLAPWDVAKDAWDATGGKVVSGTSNFVEDPGGFVQRNRHAIIDVGTGIAAVGVCATVVGCVAVAGGGLATHVIADQFFDDGRDISVGEAAFRSSTSALLGGANRAMFGQGAVPATIGITGGLPLVGRGGLQNLALNSPRWVAGLWGSVAGGTRWALSEALFGANGEFPGNGC